MLQNIELVVNGQISHRTGETVAVVIQTDRKRIKQAVGGFFVSFFKYLGSDRFLWLRKRSTLCHKNRCPAFGESLADFVTARTVLSGNGNNFIAAHHAHLGNTYAYLL